MSNPPQARTRCRFAATRTARVPQGQRRGRHHYQEQSQRRHCKIEVGRREREPLPALYMPLLFEPRYTPIVHQLRQSLASASRGAGLINTRHSDNSRDRSLLGGIEVSKAMNIEAEIHSLAAESIAVQAMLAHVLSRLAALDPHLAASIRQGFDDAASDAENLAIKFSKTASRNHLVKALAIIESLRATTLGQSDEPKHAV